MFQNSDLLITNHSNIPYSRTLVTAMLNRKNKGQCKSFVEPFSKVVKMCLEFYADQINYLFVPLDFLVGTWCNALTEVKIFKLVEKFIHLLKQALYEAITLRQGTSHIGEFSLGQAAAGKGILQENVPQKTILFFFAERNGSPAQTAMQEKLLAHARKCACDMFQ